MRVIRKSSRKERVEYSLFFERPDEPGSGMAFDCDAAGQIVGEVLHSQRMPNLEVAEEGVRSGKYKPPFVQKYVSRWTEPMVIACDCGRTLDLPGNTNGCRCSREYNAFGQLLSARVFWGEETGEHSADVARM